MKTLNLLLNALAPAEYEILSSTVAAEDVVICALCSDSRLATHRSMFFCLSGSLTDGHKYALSAYNSGCRCFAVERDIDLPPDATVIKFENTRIALARLSAEYYDHPDRRMHIIGITGTKGKTTTAMLIYKMLCEYGIESGYIGTNGISFSDKHFPTVNTTPESLELHKYLSKMLNDGTKVAVIEVSSQAIMMHRIHGVKFDTLIYTNLYPDHIGGHEHPSFEHYRDTKRSLFSDYPADTVIINSDDPYAEYMVADCNSKIIRTSVEDESPSADWSVTDARRIRTDTCLGVEFDVCRGNSHHPRRIMINLPGLINISNALASIAVCCDVFDIPLDTASALLGRVNIEGRAEVVTFDSLKGVTFVIDYAHNGASLHAMLTTLREYDPSRLICLFGSVGERTFTRRAELAAASGELADLSVITSDNPGSEDPDKIISEIAAALPDGAKHLRITRREDAIYEAVNGAERGDIILLAGKGHENYQLIGTVHMPFSDKDALFDAVERLKDAKFSKNT